MGRPFLALAGKPGKQQWLFDGVMCREQLNKCADTLRVCITHLTSPIYGNPELAVALAENPGEFLPIVSAAGGQQGGCSRVGSRAMPGATP
jgi:hypothetical protein